MWHYAAHIKTQSHSCGTMRAGIGAVKRFAGIENYCGKELIPDKTSIRAINCAPWNDEPPPHDASPYKACVKVLYILYGLTLEDPSFSGFVRQIRKYYEKPTYLERSVD